MIKLKNISLTYYPSKIESLIFKDLNLNIEKNDFIFIHGYSGSGKTSLFHLIAGLIRPQKGSLHVSIDAKNISLIEFRKNYLGFIFQDFRLLNRYTILDNLSLALKFSSIPLKQHFPMVMHYLEKFNLADKAYSYPYLLSGGELQRISIIRAMVKQPLLIIADEPFSQLDEANIQNILNTFIEIHREHNIAFLVATHFIPEHLFSKLKKYKQYRIENYQLSSMEMHS